MGIPGLMKEIGKGERTALAKLALDHFQRHKRPLRIAIDAAIWNFQTQYGGAGGKNPALRTLYFRLLRLLALPIHPVFVYDGKNKPLTKRGKTVSRYGTSVPAELSKNLVARFQFPHHVAPGEAEAECALLQKHGIVDAVMTQDVDAIMFGSGVTFRNWSKEGTKGNKAPTHVDVLDLHRIKESKLDQGGMILVAMLNGGDYHDGVPGFGPALSCEVARAGFGQELIDLVKEEDAQGIAEWRERLQYELESNESGYFAKRHKTVKVPDDFPNRTILSYYLFPAVSGADELPKLERRWLQWWDKEIDIPALRQYVAMTFDWLYRKGATYFIRSLAQPLFQHRLRRRIILESDFQISDIKDRRKHFTTDGAAEIRLTVNPLRCVGIDLSEEEENPEFADLDEDMNDLDADTEPATTQADDSSSNLHKKRQRPPWDPSISERWWVPETMLRHGLPGLMSKWDQHQAEIESDPVKFAMRKAKPGPKPWKTIDGNMKTGAMHDFMPCSKSSTVPSTEYHVKLPKSDRIARPPKEPLARSRSNPLTTLHSGKPDIQHFFKPRKQGVARESHTLKPIAENRQAVTAHKGSITKILDDCLQGLHLPDLKDHCGPKVRTGLGRSQTLPVIETGYNNGPPINEHVDKCDLDAEFLQDSLLGSNQSESNSGGRETGRSAQLSNRSLQADTLINDTVERWKQLPFTPIKALRSEVIDLTMS